MLNILSRYDSCGLSKLSDVIKKNYFTIKMSHSLLILLPYMSSYICIHTYKHIKLSYIVFIDVTLHNCIKVKFIHNTLLITMGTLFFIHMNDTTNLLART